MKKEIVTGFVVFLTAIALLGTLHAQTTLTDTTTVSVADDILLVTSSFLDGSSSLATYTLEGQRPLNEYFTSSDGETETIQYFYQGGDSINGNLLRIKHSSGIVKENLAFDADGKPTLSSITYPYLIVPRGSPSSLTLSIGYTYYDTTDGTRVETFIEDSQSDLAGAMASGSPDTVYYLEEKSFSVDAEYTRDITRTYEPTTLFSGESEYRVIETTSLVNGVMLEKYEFTYEGNNLKTITYSFDVENDGVLDEFYTITLFYNSNDLVTHYTRLDDSGLETFYYNWDRDDQFAALLSITDSEGKVQDATFNWMNSYPEGIIALLQ